MQRTTADDDVKLNEWVAAKRAKDFHTADKIRDELRARGIEPEKARPRLPSPRSAKSESHSPRFRSSPAVHNMQLQPMQQMQLQQMPAFFAPSQHHTPPGVIMPSHRIATTHGSTALAQPTTNSAKVQSTEELMEEWAAAKLTVRRIRRQLMLRGVDPVAAAAGGASLAPQSQLTPPVSYQTIIQPSSSTSTNADVSPAYRVGSGVQFPMMVSAQAETEMLLDEWDMAKRTGNFERSNQIRDLLRVRGVEPGGPGTPISALMARQKVAPPAYRQAIGRPGTQVPQHWGQQAQLVAMPSMSMLAGSSRQAPPAQDDTEALLDQWVSAKRARDFSASDRIRDILRARGIQPDEERPRLDSAANRS